MAALGWGGGFKNRARLCLHPNRQQVKATPKLPDSTPGLGQSGSLNKHSEAPRCSSTPATHQTHAVLFPLMARLIFCCMSKCKASFDPPRSYKHSSDDCRDICFDSSSAGPQSRMGSGSLRLGHTLLSTQQLLSMIYCKKIL